MTKPKPCYKDDAEMFRLSAEQNPPPTIMNSFEIPKNEDG